MAQNNKILVIDDSDLIQKLIEVRIKEPGMEILAAGSGPEGIKLARNQNPDLILLDVEMPEMNGFEVCQELKNDPATVGIPVIFITGLDNSGEKVRGFDLGAVDYVTKPFDIAELKARVRSALKIKSLMDLLASQAQLDGMTGLHNRRYFDQRLNQELSAARRYDRHVGLIIMDIDRFKQINDEHGHPKGDQVVVRVGEIIQETCRNTDIPCRYGGDEFAVILSETNQMQSKFLAGRIHSAIAQDVELTAVIGRPVTTSIGVAWADGSQEMDASGLLYKADQALYQSKEAGRNRVTLAA